MKRGSSLRLTEWPIPPTSGEVRGVAMAPPLLRRPRVLLARSRFSGGVLDGLDDVDVAGAPAEVAGDRPADVGFRRIRVGLEQGATGHQHAWSAVAALQAVLLEEAILDGMELAVPLEPFDGQEISAVGLHGEDRARLHRNAVHQDSAGAAMRRIATDVGAGQPQLFAKEVDEEEPRLDLGLVLGAVDRDMDLVTGHLYAPCARAIAFASARAVRTRAISFLYSTEPRRSAEGEAASAARREASAMAAASPFLPLRNCSAAAARTGVGPAFVRPIPTLSISPPAPRVT